MTGLIAVNGRFLTQPQTGVQRFAVEMVEALARQRDDVIVLAPPGKLLNRPEGVRVDQVGRHGGHAWEQIDMPRHLGRMGSPLLLSLGNIAPVLYRNKVSTLHDIGFIRFPQSYSRPFRLWYRLLIPLVLRTSRAILTVSDFSRSEIAGHYRLDPRTITVIPDAAADRVRVPDGNDRNREDPYFLTVGSLAAHKNLDRLMTAFGVLHGRHPEARLVVAGGGWKTLAHRNAPQQSGVTLTGRVSDEELARLYQGATAFVFPSLYEGFGIPPLEAQAGGCPVISSRSAAMPEILGDSVLYFDAESPAQMASAMERVWIDPELRGDLSGRGRLNVRRFSWDRSAGLLRGVVDDLLD